MPAHSPRVILSFCVVALFSVATALAQSLGAVRVVRSDERELLLTITPTVSTTVLPTGEVLPRVERALVANAMSPGAPLRLELRVPVALPYPSGTSLEVVSIEYAPPVAGRVAPVPALERDEQGIAREVYRVEPGLYASHVPQTPTAELRYVGIARDVHVGHIVLNPAIVDPSAGTLRLLRSATVRLRFPAAARSDRITALSEVTRGALVNAQAAGSWAIPRSRRDLMRRAAASAARAWMRVDVKEEGLYALTSEDFQRAGIDLASVDASRIAVFGTPPGGLPEDRTMIDSNRMRQVPIVVERDGSGRATRVLFYATGPNRWEYIGRDTQPTHRISPFSFTQGYLVAVDGEKSRAFATKPSPASFDVEPQWGIGRVFFDEEKVNAIDVRRVGGGSGRDWYGTEFVVDPRDRPTDRRSFVTTLAGLERGAPIAYRIRVANAGRDASIGGQTVKGVGTFRFFEGTVALGYAQIASMPEYYRSIAASRLIVLPNANAIPSDGRSSLVIEFSNVVAASGFLDYFEIHYGRRLTAADNQIAFTAPGGSGSARYRVSGFSGDDILGFDVTDPLNPLQLERLQSGEAGVFVFHDELRPARQARRYYIVERMTARRVETTAKAVFGDLRGSPRNADILVITHEDLRASAQKYVDYRNASGPLKAAYVTTEEIYTEFSSGTLDPTALRDYIGQALNEWAVAPQYVILLGDATYDYRNIVTTQKQLVPTMQLPTDNDNYDENYSTNADDYFARISVTDSMIDLITGRFPVETVDQADAVIEKLRRYEQAKNFGGWRHTTVMAADDDIPCGKGGGFVTQSERTLASNSPAWVEARKIYLPGYPTEKVPSDHKPGATADLMQFINRGAVITNFLGHGNPKQWAHELLLEKDQFIPRLTNDSTPTFIVAATCNFGLFDDPGQLSGAEMFFLRPSGGAIALVSSSRASFIFGNEDMVYEYFDQLYRRDAVTGRYPTIGAAFFATKLTGSDPRNDEKYHIFGDPSMRLNVPESIVTIDTVNGVSLADSSVTVGALSVVTVSGTVTDPFGRVMEDFDGTVNVSLFDVERTATAAECGGTLNWRMAGGRLFRGPAYVVDGRFRTTFRVPKDIAYDSSAARLHAYAYSATTDAIGSSGAIRVFGSDDGEITDTNGPQISIFLDDRSFRSGDIVTAEPLLIVDLSDTSGINSSGSSLGHRIEAWIDGDPRAIDLTEYFQTGPSDYRIGTAERTLIDLEPGEHSVKVRAWDIFNNPRVGTAVFRITDGGESSLFVSNIVNYPNPMSRETEFTFQHNQSRPLDVVVAIFTIAGRKVRELEARSVNDRFVRVSWDGADVDGAPLANGVYLYRLRVSVPGDESVGTFETIEKVAVVR